MTHTNKPLIEYWIDIFIPQFTNTYGWVNLRRC